MALSLPKFKVPRWLRMPAVQGPRKPIGRGSALLEPKYELRYDPAQVEALGQGKSYHLLGRLVARRGFGKASFLRLRDVSGEIQLFAKQDVMGEAFASLEDIDIADHIEVRGRAEAVTEPTPLMLSLGFTGFTAMLQEDERPGREEHLRKSLNEAFDEEWLELMRNPDTGVMAGVYHLSGQIEGSLSRTETLPIQFEPVPRVVPLPGE